MILNGPGKISIMVGGQVVGMAKDVKLSIAEDDASTKEFSDPWRTPYIKQSWNISCDAMVRDAGDVLRDLLNGKEKWDVAIGQEVGKLPRKMKKALHSKRMTKWKRKAICYRRRHVTMLNAAEVVVTKKDQETLTATITKAMEEDVPRARVSGEDIMKAMEKYKTRKGV